MAFYTNETKDAIVIFAGHVARELLRKGYTIIDVKPDKKNRIKSVFVFKCENDIEKVLHDIIHREIEDVFATEK